VDEIGMGATTDARPIHRVFVDGFYMDKTDVTNAQFSEFVKATISPQRSELRAPRTSLALRRKISSRGRCLLSPPTILFHSTTIFNGGPI
jgi:formylglycine-generating enzyme required for sulfatase activity